MNDDRQVRPFADWLRDQRNGRTHDELSDALNELVEAVQEHGKAGSITFIVKVKPAGRGDHGTVLVSDDVRLKAPTGERPETVFFADDDHNLVRHNPAQPSLPLREVPRAEVTADEKGGAVNE